MVGRPENKRIKKIDTLMNENEEAAYLEYLKGWKTNKEVTGKLTENSIKNVSSKTGRYCNKLRQKKCLNKSKKYIRYSFKTPKGKKATKGGYVPAYKGNIHPLISYFFLTASDGELYAFSDKYSIPILYLFFELNETREFLILFSKITFNTPLATYSSFLRTIDDKLIVNWLYFEKSLHPSAQKSALYEEYFINKIPKVNKIKKFIEKYLKDKRDDFEKLDLREEIIKEYNSSWKEFEKTALFEKIMKINRALNKKTPKEILKKEIKIKYFSRLLYLPSTSKSIKNTFLGTSGRYLVNLQEKKESPAENNALKYQLFNSKSGQQPTKSTKPSKK